LCAFDADGAIAEGRALRGDADDADVVHVSRVQGASERR
jgi:hypothetical protein